MAKAIRDYYEVVGVAKTATPDEIKRAYFGKVRQYPPERFPEEFKELRAAYDTLQDKEKRKRYDAEGAIPKAVLSRVYDARNAHTHGNHGKAAEAYEAVLKLHPELDKVREEYAWTLESGGKNGKATKVWEQLCKQCPANVEYIIALAKSYNKRGWEKKALLQYRRAIELDKSNSTGWLAYIRYYLEGDERDEACKICKEALEAVGDKGDVTLYVCGFSILDKNDKAIITECLQKCLRRLKETPVDSDELEIIVDTVYHRVEDKEYIDLYPYLKELAAMLPHIDDDLKSDLAWTERNYTITNFDNKFHDSVIHDILVIQNNKDDTHDEKLDMAGLEYALLAKKDFYSTMLIRLKKEYPDIYDLHKNFFEEVLATKNPQKLMEARKKYLAKHNMQPIGSTGDNDDEDEYYEPVKTIRRESPKVGRNDPCPCGSGKKYKKCCGA